MEENNSELKQEASALLDEIRAKIEAKRFYFLQHLLYIKQIEEKKLSEDEIEEYLADVFTFIKIDAKDTQNFIAKLKEVLLQKLKFYMDLKQICMLEQQATSISVLYFLIQSELCLSSYDKAIQKSNIGPKESKAVTLFSDRDFFRSIFNSLKPFLPQGFDELSNMVTFRIVDHKKFSRLDKSCNKNTPPQSCIIDWNPFTKRMTSFLERNKITTCDKGGPSSPELLEKIQKCASFSELDSMEIPAENGLYEILSMFVIFNVIYKQNNKKDEYRMSLDLQENVGLFYEIYGRFQKVKEKITEIKNEEKNRIALENNYQKTRNYILQEIEELEKTCAKQKKLLTEYCLDRPESIIPEQELVIISNTLLELAANWPPTLPQNIHNLNTFMDLLGTFRETVKIQKTKLQEQSSVITLLRKELKKEAIKNKELKKIEEKNARELERKARQQFFEEQTEKFKKYRESVDKKREEKQQTKKVIVSHEKIEPNYQTNSNMELILQNLSPRHFELLKAIVACQEGIKYSDLYFLFTNHLGATISEIGNGSSHLQIKIQKYQIEIVTNVDKKFIEQKKPEVATGGMFRQHGKSHTNDKLCRFNLKLIKILLSNAGITIQAIASLEEKRLPVLPCEQVSAVKK